MPSLEAGPPLPSLICVTGRGGALCGDDGWSRWSPLHLGPPGERNKEKPGISQTPRDKSEAALAYCASAKRPAHLLPSHGERSVEPLLKGDTALEDGWQQEVEQCPQLRQLVLQRRPCEEDSPWGKVVSVQDLGQFTVVVLHTVALVNDHVLPTDLVGMTWGEKNIWMKLPVE